MLYFLVYPEVEDNFFFIDFEGQNSLQVHILEERNVTI
ncbi:putative uncharacterized protein [Parachlamydia acanthamoebae UV-7]|uniref:Uncharacterized protein n=1 Tax=Parachlamydia acanthamoebae (strain UV7) TaxID=765952 RepID=F8KWU4_PARAV|nr:hypothetical protein pah_c008o035 [Parachlamydia acanthamoebae str. Hall's coccus]CCB86407.1 putative uncharacterized protein [Parachlamydia acanthamoebae UV-7]